MADVRLQIATTIELEDLDELTDEESQALEEDVHEILETEAANMQGMAQGTVPVRTGNLMSSIFAEVEQDNLAVALGATANYASFVEYGTRKMMARPFLTPAADVGQEEMNARIEQAVVDRLDGKISSPEEGENATIEIEGVTQVVQGQFRFSTGTFEAELPAE
jgi:HK97 gp10 family phage protein